jgi:hypothetical protein
VAASGRHFLDGYILMVLSRINPSLSYTEWGHNIGKGEHDVYEIELIDVPVLVVAGRIKRHTLSSKVWFASIHLVLTDNQQQKTACIGVVESDAEDFNVEAKEPLLFSFVSSDWLHIWRKIPEPDQTESGIKMQTKEEAADIRARYHERADDSWIAKMMHNRAYVVIDRRLVDVLGQADVIAKIVACPGVQEELQRYQDRADTVAAMAADVGAEVKDLAEQYAACKAKHVGTIDRAERDKLVERAAKIKVKYDRAVLEKRVVVELAKQAPWLKQAQVKTTETFASAAADAHLPIAEVATGVRLLPLLKGDLGRLLERWTPVAYDAANRYAMVDVSADKKIVMYDGRTIMRENELPYDMRCLMDDKRAEQEAVSLTRSDLYDDDVTLCLDGTKTEKSPGFAYGDKVPIFKALDFALLGQHPDWRSRLGALVKESLKPEDVVLLKLTRRAKLVTLRRGQPPKEATDLMMLRREYHD